MIINLSLALLTAGAIMFAISIFWSLASEGRRVLIELGFKERQANLAVMGFLGITLLLLGWLTQGGL